MKVDGVRKIKTKNYIILGIIILVTLLILYYFYIWVDAYKESKMNIPIMDKYMEVINYNELDNYIVENPNSIIYVSVLENEKIRNFEKEFKNKYKNHQVNDGLLYMNITDEVNNKNTLDDMVESHSLNSLNITDVPCVLVFNDGELRSIYSVEDNDYNIDRFLIYVNNVLLESDDIK